MCVCSGGGVLLPNAMHARMHTHIKGWGFFLLHGPAHPYTRSLTETDCEGVMASYGDKETEQLKSNIQSQLNRLLSQLQVRPRVGLFPWRVVSNPAVDLV